jgi:hypothetical protein
MPIDYQIHAVAFRSGSCWVAQCLEYDIATQAKSLCELLYEVERILAAHFIVAKQEGVAPFAGIPKAPKRYWEMYRNGKPLPDATPESPEARVQMALAA